MMKADPAPLPHHAAPATAWTRGRLSDTGTGPLVLSEDEWPWV